MTSARLCSKRALICGLLVLGLCSGFRAALGRAVGDQLPTKNLVQLIESMKQSVRPSDELVFDAYEDYVALHRIQSGQVGSLGAQLLGASEQEQKETRELIGSILNDQMVRVASEDLFSLIPDDNTDGKFKKTDRLRRVVSNAIRKLGF